MSEEMGITVKKDENFSEWFSQVIQKAELADIRYNVKGFLVHMPWSVWIMKSMYALYEKELERRGHKPVLLPIVIPKSNLEKEAEHAEGFSAEAFWVTKGGEENFEEPLALRPTSETIFGPMFSQWIRSYNDLPMKFYHSCAVYRHETKATRPFIRGREFYWIEAHNCFATEEEAKKQVKEDMEMTEEIMGKIFCVPFIFFKRVAWDVFKGADVTFAADSIMPDGRAIQQPSTHLLGQRFAKMFGIKYMDEKGKEKHVYQTCYGPCIWRILASVVALHGDDKGLILPPKIAPLDAIIIPILFKAYEKEVLDKSKELKEKLEGKFKVELDASDKTAGFKFNEWELKGVPIRLEIGPKDVKLNQVVLVRRDTAEKVTVKEAEIENKITEILEDIQKNLYEGSKGKLIVHEAGTLKDVEGLAKKGGFIRVPWCSIEKDGELCADKLQEKTTLQVRGTMFGKKEKPKGKCIICGKEAKEVVYLAKAY